MRLLFFILCLWPGLLAMAQKKPLDYSSYADWPSIHSAKISRDGKYVMYVHSTVDKGPALIVASTDLSWKKEFPGVFDGSFTRDDRRLIFSKPTDSIGILELGSGELQFIENVGEYTVPTKGDGQWLAYHVKDRMKSLVLLNLNTKEKAVYSN